MKCLSHLFLASAAVATMAMAAQATTISLPGLSTADIVEAAPGVGEILEGVNDNAGTIAVPVVDGLNNIDFNAADWTYTYIASPGNDRGDWAAAANNGATDPGSYDYIGFTSGIVTHASSLLLAANTKYTFSVDLFARSGFDTAGDWDISLGANNTSLAALGNLAPDLNAANNNNFDVDETTAFTTQTVSFTTGAIAPAGTSFGDAVQASINQGGVNGPFFFLMVRSDTMTLTETAVPEPASFVLLSIGGVLICGGSSRRS